MKIPKNAVPASRWICGPSIFGGEDMHLIEVHGFATDKMLYLASKTNKLVQEVLSYGDSFKLSDHRLHLTYTDAVRGAADALDTQRGKVMANLETINRRQENLVKILSKIVA